MQEVVLIEVTGRDRPGITMTLTQALARDQVRILDIGQSVIHNTLALGILVELPTDSGGCQVFRELLFAAHRLGLDARFTPIESDAYEDWVREQGQPRHILTLLGAVINAEHIAQVAAVVSRHGLNIDQITRLSGRISQRPEAAHHSQAAPGTRPACVELWLRGPVPDISALHASFLQLGSQLDVDIAIQEDDIFRRNRRLVCFDMDSTLIQTEVIDELATAAGVGQQVAAITERAMRGELDFGASFRERVALLKGLEESVLAGIAARLPITPGAERLIQSLKALGYRIAILSGGFTYFAEHLKQRLGIDIVHANPLDSKDGRLTGEVTAPIVDGARKAQLLREIATQEGIRLEQVIAVGDGANDLPMLAIAGLGIAFHAKPLVKEQARHSLAAVGLDGILYLLGMRDRDLEHLSVKQQLSAETL
ncbi:phosphoserine phosphatase SerB [Thiorhodovibrio frisius]|uniref:Phosphoserine phosphatase n=1 Tax=Thiorhodovibrio frisius TaxID=631362 RepID=H8YYL1_9GAMM|nr:phosphoserine phosphatase SerB [Thiorhodovibrio frisius]EIC23537.1 phosphoserine phosphatase SerB [Thiorhodovibrio frisius]WPL23376.1 Phosphoserine phosphatase [Thiorhodovibrio frisius]